jgi:hypothetical protein
MHERDLAEWDREIEADFQRAVAATKRTGRHKRGQRLVAFPWAFLVDVCRLTEGRTALVLAEYIYRRTYVCRDRTVTLPAGDLAELGINRQRKAEALAKLEAAGVIRLERVVAGRSAKVTLTWRPS